MSSSRSGTFLLLRNSFGMSRHKDALFFVLGISCAHSLNVAVVGGSGFVGSRIVKLLSGKEGVSVTSLSRSGRAPTWAVGEAWVNSVKWESLDVVDEGDAALDKALVGTEALVSCVGVVGTDPDALLEGNGVSNRNVFLAGQRAGVERCIYVSVSSEVAACQENWLPGFFSSYFEGKDMAEVAVNEAVGGDASRTTIVKPTFIYGGDSFELLPPRVAANYGSGVEELLSFKPFRMLADATPGMIKVALRPPVSVDAVAGACVAGALGEVSGVFDGTDAIKAATREAPSTGLTEALVWATEEMKKAALWAKSKVDEISSAS